MKKDVRKRFEKVVDAMLESPQKMPAYALEYLKLREFEESWGSYHCTHVLGSDLAYVELKAQRERFKRAIEAEIHGIRAAFPTGADIEEVKKAAAAFEKLLDSPSGLQISKTKAGRKGKGRA